MFWIRTEEVGANRVGDYEVGGFKRIDIENVVHFVANCVVFSSETLFL